MKTSRPYLLPETVKLKLSMRSTRQETTCKLFQGGDDVTWAMCVATTKATVAVAFMAVTNSCHGETSKPVSTFVIHLLTICIDVYMLI